MYLFVLYSIYIACDDDLKKKVILKFNFNRYPNPSRNSNLFTEFRTLKEERLYPIRFEHL